MSNGTTLNISNMSNSEIAQLDADDIANLNNQDLVSFTAEQISLSIKTENKATIILEVRRIW